jgi:four helix bundle protein
MFYGYGLLTMGHGLKNMAFKFEELKVWQRALDFTLAIHQVTLGFPKEELFVLSSQIKRAANSIAEGSTGQSNPEFNKFLGYAVRSAIEVVSCLHIGRKRCIIKDDDFQSLYTESTIIIKMIQALRNSLN